ncbi:MAG: LytTR family DNA-binding domain-containing protein [Bacteroidales bacterium]|nr:LytTR family DNA-binding domain-containing protein [Bacteroidales bacterium]
MKIKTFILDDEKDSIATIKSLIELYDIEAEIIGEAQTIKEAYNKILAQRPQLLLLDMCIGDEKGFDLLEMISLDNMQLICISAYDEYAVKAFKYSAIDYLLKPIDSDELEKSVNRARDNIELKQSILPNLNALIENYKLPHPCKLSISSSDGLEFIDINNIITIRAEGSYTELSLVDRKKRTVSKSIGEFMEQMPENEFCRVHNSYAVNLQHVNKVYRKGGMEVEMINGERIPIARNKKEYFMTRIKSVVHFGN